MDEKRIADYFVITGISGDNGFTHQGVPSHESILMPKSMKSPAAPITDVTVIIRSAGEVVPEGWTCVETTVSGFPADLNHGSLGSSSVYLCYKRGRDKPPLVDIGILYEGKERVMSDSEMVKTTFGERSANVNNGLWSFSRTFLTFRRAQDNNYNQLAVTDVCVILGNKGEIPPHNFCLINKNLNTGMIGSDVFLCYKKSINRPAHIFYKPSIEERVPIKDYPPYSLPNYVSLFCFPMGATIECWPNTAQPKPIFSSFVLTLDSSEKIYGTAYNFYEKFNDQDLNEEQLQHLTYSTKEGKENKTLYKIKSIGIVSRLPQFETFERFLLFLYNNYITSKTIPLKISLERYISHFMSQDGLSLLNTSNLLVEINKKKTMILTGASFIQILRTLGPENCIYILLFALTETNILLNSLIPNVLTRIAEAIHAMIYPFCWQYSYMPMCPISLHDALKDPNPFIVGVHSAYFDHFLPPINTASIDLDTNSMYLPGKIRFLNISLMPERETTILKNTLQGLFERILKLPEERNDRIDRIIEYEIQEAFIRFMVSIMRNVRAYLLPTRAPIVGDPSSLFDMQGFLKSRNEAYHPFYSILMKTKMFLRFIEELSYVSDKNTNLALFDICSEKLESMDHFGIFNPSIRLLDIEDHSSTYHKDFFPFLEPVSPEDEFTYQEFSLDPSLYL